MALTQAALDKLLQWLDSDRDRAAEKYEKIRTRLIHRFAWRGCELSEVWADETIDRVARKLHESVLVHTSDPYTYFSGVAWKVTSEVLKKQGQAPATEPVPQAGNAGMLFDGPDRTYDCMQHCLEALPAAERELIIEYHKGEKSLRVENRRQLAAHMGFSPNALRIHCRRIRETLHACKEDCLKRS